MNWEEIQKKCPKGWKKLENWSGTGDWLIHCIIGDSFVSNNRFTNLRDLYNFFDENKIYIRITPVFDSGKDIIFVASVFDEFNNYELDEFETRLEAEKAAFNKAFEILEKC